MLLRVNSSEIAFGIIGAKTDKISRVFAIKHLHAGFEIDIDPAVEPFVYVAGAKISDTGELVTAGGRVLGVTAVSDTLKGAISTAYDRVSHVGFVNAYYRTDIGARALAAIEEK